MRLRQVGGSYIEFFPGDFGHYHRYDFSVGFTMDVNENELEHEILIFPNPSAGVTTFEISGLIENNAEIEIIDLFGRVMHREKMVASQYFAEAFIDVSLFKTGSYLVKIKTGNSVYTKAFSKL